MKITRKMKVQIFHRNNLRITAAGSTALDSEARSEGRLAESDHGLLAELTKCLAEADSRSSLSFPCGSRIDGSHKDQLALRLSFKRLQKIIRKLRLVLAVQFQIIHVDVKFFRYFPDGLQSCFLCDLNIGLHAASSVLLCFMALFSIVSQSFLRSFYLLLRSLRSCEMQKTQTLYIIANSLLFSNLVPTRKMCNFSEFGNVTAEFLSSVFSISKS